MSQTICQEPRPCHWYPEQHLSSSVLEFQVPVFKNPKTPGYICCVPSFRSLVTGNTVQEVQQAVEDCVADFVEICVEGGHKLPAAPKAPSQRLLHKQDGFQQLVTIRVPGELHWYLLQAMTS